MESMRKAPVGHEMRPPLDRTAIERRAIDYIGRYEAPAARVSAVLRRMVDRESRRQSLDREAAYCLVADVVADMVARGLIVDRRYAEIRFRSLRERGAAIALIRQDLRSHGIDSGTIDAVTQQAGVGSADEIAAAIAFARRRRIGPFRPSEARLAHRQRDLAALGRRGFGSEIARRIVDAEDADALLEDAAEP